MAIIGQIIVQYGSDKFNFLDKLICDRLVKTVINFLHNEKVLDRAFQIKELKK